MLDEDEIEHPNFVGFPRRDGDRVTWVKPETVHHQINTARRFDLRAIEVSSEPAARPQEVRERELAATVSAAEFDENAWLGYQSIAGSNGRRRDPLVLERVRAILADPPSIRASGFNFRSASEPEWVGGRAIELSGRSMALRVTDSGVITAVFGANESCLGWALSQHLEEGAPLQINPITLTEFTLELFRLVDDQLASLFGDPTWLVRLVARRMKSEQIVLRPGPILSRGIPLTPPGLEHLARDDEWEAEFTATGDPEKDAFVALVHVYALFGLSSQAIPYAEHERVPTEQVAAL
jgi:hypothetical protein